MLRWQTEKLTFARDRRDSWTVSVRPELVVEVAFNEIQESPRYPGGLALRFARVKRFRPDKSPSESDTFQTVRAYLNANGNKTTGASRLNTAMASVLSTLLPTQTTARHFLA